MAIFGPSGAGKTYTSLRIATGIGDKIAVIDTERGSASRYADRFDYDVLELPETDIDTYIAGMVAAHEYDVLIIDSLSHAWQALLEEIDRLAKTKYRGNTWSAWSEGTPKQRRFVDALLSYPGHVIATMRSKTEWTLEKDSRTDKNTPVRVGLAPEQGKGIEYEFDVLMELTTEHYGTIIKDRTGKFQDRIIQKPGEDFGKELVAWLADGEVPQKQDDGQRERERTQSQPQVATPKRQAYPERPWDAETAKRAILAKADKIGDERIASPKFVGFVAGHLEELFGNEPRDLRTAKRHSVIRYVFDSESMSALTMGECKALKQWSTDEMARQDGETKLLPNEYAISEAAAMVKAYEAEKGQQEMAL